MRRALPIGLLGLALTALPARGRPPEAAYLQAANSRDHLLLEVGATSASVHHPDGRAERVRLRSGERLLAFEELEAGWIAAGIRVEDGGADLFLVEQGPSGSRRLGLPGSVGAPPPLRTRPVLLTAGGTLVGLAWLEGAPGEPLTVRAARRSDVGWERSGVVSAPSRGSQTGLVGAVLPDGRWLLAWSRFDGSDDEMVWSLGDANGWSAPRPVHPDNDTPDVAPALFADGGLVLMAWSRLIGNEYRVLTSAWGGDGWSAPRTVGAPGTLYPAFAGLDGDPYLLLRDARTRGWELVDLDRRGRALRRLGIGPEDASTGRPAFAGSSGTVARLLLPRRGGVHDATWEAVP